MLNLTTPPGPPSPHRALRIRVSAQAGRRASVKDRTRAQLLADYLEGWAEADPVKIADATAPEYRFDDPFVGTFSTLALPRYFAALKSRSGLGALADREHLTFVLRGPMVTLPSNAELQFWREAPRLGLTGISHVTVEPAGVVSERVAYDLNIASEQLRRPL
jgi:hypothetical protein